MNSSVTSIDDYVDMLPDWQAANLRTFRTILHDVAPDISEAIKWGVPAFPLGGKIVFTMAAFKQHTKYNFILNGAQLSDPDHLFNNGLESTKSRSIDLREQQSVDEAALRRLVEQSLTYARS